MDSYKSPTTSLQGLVLEALSLISDAGSAPATRQQSAKKSASQIINELSFRFSGNWIAKRCVGVGFEELCALDPESSTIDNYRRWLEVVHSELDGHQYIAEIVDELVFYGNSNEKKKIDLLAKEFVSTLQGLGVSRDHIYTSVTEFFFSTEVISNAESIKDFCKIVYPHAHSYSVAVGVTDEIRTISSELLSVIGILVLDDESNNEGIEPETHNSLKVELNATNVALISVRATDYNSAVIIAKKKIDDLGAFFRIFNHKSKEHLKNLAY